MFDFGIGYCYRLYNQIKNIYQIKQYIDKIYNSNINDNDANDQNDSIEYIFESIKQKIFACGSLYVKFFQWYISKLKSTVIDKTYKTYKTYNECNYNTNVKKITKFIKYFEDIFENCPYHDIEHTKKIFNNSMPNSTLEKYIDINTLGVIASGSIGQVYYARRLEDNLEIAIKVKHPNIEKDLENQKELIKFIKFIQYIPYFKNKYNLYFNIDDFLSDINLQCDFNNEANNCKTFQDNFKESSTHIIFPKILYQSNDMIISEFIEGDSFNNLTDIQKYQTSINFICFFYQMLFVDNFIHGDLHCKNWKVRLNKETNIIQIIVYDCGICFQNTSLELTNSFWFALVNYDIKTINKTLRQFIVEITNNNNVINDEILENKINSLFNIILKESISTSTIFKIIIEFFKINNIVIPKFLLNLSILICVVEEFLKDNNLIDKHNEDNENNTNNETNENNKRIETYTKKNSMFEIANECDLDIIAFCDVKKCYLKVRDLFNLHMNDKYKNYKTNIANNNINENLTTEKRLFSSLSLSGLSFKPPE